MKRQNTRSMDFLCILRTINSYYRNFKNLFNPYISEGACKFILFLRKINPEISNNPTDLKINAFLLKFA